MATPVPECHQWHSSTPNERYCISETSFLGGQRLQSVRHASRNFLRVLLKLMQGPKDPPLPKSRPKQDECIAPISSECVIHMPHQPDPQNGRTKTGSPYSVESRELMGSFSKLSDLCSETIKITSSDACLLAYDYRGSVTQRDEIDPPMRSWLDATEAIHSEPSSGQYGRSSRVSPKRQDASCVFGEISQMIGSAQVDNRSGYSWEVTCDAEIMRTARIHEDSPQKTTRADFLSHYGISSPASLMEPTLHNGVIPVDDESRTRIWIHLT